MKSYKAKELTEPGYYWTRGAPSKPWFLTEVILHKGYSICDWNIIDGTIPAAGEYHGPLLPPDGHYIDYGSIREFAEITKTLLGVYRK